MRIRRKTAAPILGLWVMLHVAAGALAQTPVINEFMAANATTIQDDDGDFSDWLELYNPGPAAFDLTGCYLSDDPDNPLRWRFPAAALPADGFLLIWASGKDRADPSGALHTNFAISAGGEPLLLSAADGATRLDEVAPQALAADLSFGRLPDGGAGWVVFGVPTPGTANDAGLQYLAAPMFSPAPGFFDAAITLALAAADPEAEIRYTVDGSEPTASSSLYTAPLPLASRDGDPNIYSLIPTNFVEASNHYGWRPPRGEVFKLNIVRARAFRAGHVPSAVATGSFIIDPDPAGRLRLPVISLATSPENLFDDEIGIYVPGNTYIPGDLGSGNYFHRGDEWERPLHVEFFDLQGTALLAQDAGARIYGGYSRRYPQKSLRLIARAEYGPTRFDGVLFEDLPYDSYNCFLIRNAGNDWGRTGFRDLALQTMCKDMGFDTQAGRPVVHFINGEYWGLANLRERYDRHYLARVYGVPEEAVALLVENAELEEGLPSDRDDYLALRSFVTDHDMNEPANLAYAAERMDLENFTAYNVAEIYIANYDWPGVNVRYWRRTLPAYDPGAPYGHDGRWRWLMYDVDWTYAFAAYAHQTLAHATAPASPEYWNPPWSTAFLRGLLQSDRFRRDFINTFADHLNSTFVPARLIAIIDEFAERYWPAIADWQDRWDLVYDWAYDVEDMRRFANRRPAYMRTEIVDHFGLAGTCELTLGVNNPAWGKLQINQLVIDAALPGLADPAAPYPWTGTYFQGVPVAVTALPAPGHRFLAWQHDGGIDPVLTIVPGAQPLALMAIFAIDASQPVVLHAWHFNDLPAGTLTEIAADSSLAGGAVIAYPGTGAGFLDRVDDGTALGALPDAPAGYALRMRNPSATRNLVLAAPSSGYEALTLSYAAKRTTNGAEEHSLWCRLTTDGPWHLVAESVAVGEAYQLCEYDLSANAGTADNADLVLRFSFGGANAGGDSGNQRFDNLTLRGSVLAAVNLPPQVTGPIGTQQASEGGEPLVLDLATVFTDPEGDPLIYTAASSDPLAAAVALAGSQLTIAPLARGEATITVTASDGANDPVEHLFQVVVHAATAPTALHGNAPNPFTQATHISFSVRNGDTGRLEIFDNRGQRVRSLGRYTAGMHRVAWAGDDDRGRRCASGVYYYRLSTEDGRWTRKMIVVR